LTVNRRILVLEDEPGILDAYRAVFEPAAPVTVRSSRSSSATLAAASLPQEALFQVTYASNGLEALKMIEEAVKTGQPYVGGFFDVKLGPGIDGIETIRRAKEIEPDLHCVITTAYQDRSVDEITNIFGEEFSDRWDFLSKPFSHPEILQKARQLSSHWDRRKREREHLQTIQEQQEQIIRSERLAAMGTLARGIGHEFGNVLLRMIGKAQLSLQKKDPTEMATALQTIVDAALRAGVIVRNFQGLVKVEAKREMGSILEPIQDSLSLINHELKNASIVVKENHAADLPNFLMSRVELGQVFLNFFINAKHAMEPNGGTLTITTAKDRNGLRVSVADTGCGIPPENLTRIFEHLFTTKGEKGSGIGLSVSKSIVDKHHGKITVSSQPGKGTTFDLWFPLLALAPSDADTTP
jgi:two-component system NtrC family sensor kinase